MKRNLKLRKRSPKEQVKERVFTTVEEFSSYFFPKERVEKETTKGKERGTKAAENAFTEIAKGLQP
jgi:hypothetical protein